MRPFVVVLGIACVVAVGLMLLRGRGDGVPAVRESVERVAESSAPTPAVASSPVARAQLDEILESLPTGDDLANPESPGDADTSQFIAMAPAGCGEYDVIDMLTGSLDIIDVDKALNSLQLNPRCCPMPESGLNQLKSTVEEFRRRDQKASHILGVMCSNEMAEQAAIGAIPVMGRSVAPKIFDSTMRRCEREYQGAFPEAVASNPDWRSSKEFRDMFRDRFKVRLFDETPYSHYINIGATGEDYVARSIDIPVYSQAFLDGHREIIATELVSILLNFYSSHGALQANERDDLWARFVSEIARLADAKAKL